MVLALAALTLTGAACVRNDAALAGPVVRPRDEAPLWKAAFALDREPASREAEALLLQAGPEGYTVLSRLARAGGEAEALQVIASEARCLSRFSYSVMHRAERGPSWYAARLAGRMLAASPELRTRALGSEEAFDRKLALVASIQDPAALLTAVAALRTEQDLHVLSAAEGAVRCAGNQPRLDEAQRDALKVAGRGLSERLTLSRPEQGCGGPEGVTEELVERVASGAWRVNGWSTSGDTFTVMMDLGRGGRMHLAPECALPLYDALARRDVYLSGLVVPLGTLGTGTVRSEAGRRAARDLGHFPEQERNRVAAQLVNAGHAVPVRVTVSEETLGQEEELEAAVRQQQPGAVDALERHVFCRGTFGSSGIELLGYVRTRQAADTAFQLAQRCPKALGAATAALVRLEDRRALELLALALRDSGFSGKALERAILEHYTPEVDRALQALEEGGSSEAKALRQRHQAETAPAPRG
jgi:hypothetical protein